LVAGIEGTREALSSFEILPRVHFCRAERKGRGGQYAFNALKHVLDVRLEQ